MPLITHCVCFLGNLPCPNSSEVSCRHSKFLVYSTDARPLFGFHLRSINFHWVWRAVEVNWSSEVLCLTAAGAKQHRTMSYGAFSGRLGSSLCTAWAGCGWSKQMPLTQYVARAIHEFGRLVARVSENSLVDWPLCVLWRSAKNCSWYVLSVQHVCSLWSIYVLARHARAKIYLRLEKRSKHLSCS